MWGAVRVQSVGDDGVLTFQWPFLLVGARTAVTNLWEVDEEAPPPDDSLLLRLFSSTMGRDEALVEAQTWRMSEGSEKGIDERGMKIAKKPEAKQK